MKLFVTAAIGAALLAGCAPFEHGHYADDVSYQNTKGDPAGTPLVYQGSSTDLATYDTPGYNRVAYGHSPAKRRYRGHGLRHASVAAPQYSYAPPTTYSAPVTQSHGSYANATSYLQPATTSTWSAPTHSAHNVVATSYGGSRVDADGYLICDIPWPSHGANQVPRF